MSDNLILAALARLEAGQASLRDDVASLRADVGRLDATQASLRVDIVARMDRLPNSLTDIRNDMSVNFGSAEAVERANDNTRDTVLRVKR